MMRMTYGVGKTDADTQHDAADNEHAEAAVPWDCPGGEAGSNEVADAGDDHADLAALELCHIAGHQGGKESWTRKVSQGLQCSVLISAGK